MTLLEKFKGTLTAQNVFLDENTGGKGKYFKARFLQPGLVKYSFGVCVLEKDTIDKFINGFVGCPVIIGHKDVTSENAKELSCGNICHIWYDDLDGWYWGDGIIDNDEALELINQGYNVSCQYEITEFANNTTNALHNGNPYDKVILNGKPEHLAIVDRPRYENAMIAVNALDKTEDSMKSINNWNEQDHPRDEQGKFTEKGAGSVKDYYESEYQEALKEIAEGKDYAQINFNTNIGEMKMALAHLKRYTDWDKYDVYENIKEYEDLSDDWNKEQISRIAREKAAQETLKKWISEGKDRKNEYYKIYEPQKAKNCIVQAINEIKETDMFKKLFNRKEQQMEKDEMKSLFIECLQECLQAKNEEDKEDDKKDEKVENEEEKDLKKEDEKEAENKCKNEVVDKRDIIRQIMAIAGKEEASEDVKTIAKLAEKLAYDKSEADTADNCGKKGKNEDEEDKEKEEAKNKAKNSIEEVKALFSSSEVQKSASSYVSRDDAIKLGNELF